MIRFYYASGSPFAWRVHLALEEKGLAYQPALLSFQAGDLRKPEYLALSPHGKVPAITDGEVKLYESQAILEYLEEEYPDRPLLPDSNAERALVRIEEQEATLYFFGAFQGVARQAFFTPPDQRDHEALQAARAASRAELERLEARAAARGKDCILGGRPTRADFTWVPFVEIAGRGGIELDAGKTPWLVAWRERMRKRPSYDASYPPHWRGK